MYLPHSFFPSPQARWRPRWWWASWGTRPAGSVWIRRASVLRAAWCPSSRTAQTCPAFTSSLPHLTPPGVTLKDQLKPTLPGQTRHTLILLFQVCIQAFYLLGEREVRQHGDVSSVRPRRSCQDTASIPAPGGPETRAVQSPPDGTDQSCKSEKTKAFYWSNAFWFVFLSFWTLIIKPIVSHLMHTFLKPLNYQHDQNFAEKKNYFTHSSKNVQL